MSDNLYENEDLLSLLSSSLEGTNKDNEEDKSYEGESVSPNNDTVEDEDKEVENKLRELRDLAKSAELVESSQGTGDIDEDLINWFDGVDKLPSEPLGRYVSNSSAKIETGLRRTTLSNKEIQVKLKRFLVESIDTLFNPSNALSLSPEEFIERYKIAFTSYKELSEYERKVNKDIKDYQLRSASEGDDLDSIKMLLATIPHDKLKKVLMDIQKG